MIKALRKGRPTAEFDDESRTITWVMTTGVEDRDGETVDPEGGDFGEFMKNPTVQFNHDTDDFPIGRLQGEPWNDYVGEGTKYDIGGPRRMALLGKVFFSKENPKGDLAYRMAKEGTLGGGSISFLPTDPPRKNGNGGNHYSNWKLLEFTICPIGSNPDAVKLSLRAALKALDRIHAGNAEVGEVVVARRAIMSGSEYFAEPGDRLVVVEVVGGEMRVRNEAGEEKLVISNDVRRKTPLQLILVGDEVEVIPGSGGHTQYYGGERGTVTEVRPTGYKVQIPGEPYSVAFEKDEVKLTRKKSQKLLRKPYRAEGPPPRVVDAEGDIVTSNLESMEAAQEMADSLNTGRYASRKAQDPTYEVWVIRGSNKIVVYQGDTKPSEEAAHRLADKLGQEYDDVKIVTRPVKLSYKAEEENGEWFAVDGDSRFGPFMSQSIAQVWADRLNLGKTMKKRRLFHRDKSMRLLKNEGPIEPELQEYLENRGLEDIQLVDEPPAEEEKYEEIEPEDFLPLGEEEEKVPQEGPGGTQFEVFRGSGGKYFWREIGGSRNGGPMESESIAENNAWRQLGKSMGVKFVPREMGGQWYCVSLEKDEQTGPYASREEAQRACDEANAKLTPEEKEQPSDDIDSAKACKILEDGMIDGVPLTEEQRGMFGAACARSKKFKSCEQCKKKSLCPCCVATLRKSLRKQGRFGSVKPGDKFQHPALGELTLVSVGGDPANTSDANFTDEDGKPVRVSMTDPRLSRKNLKRKNADGPAGLRALKAWIKQIETDVAELEQPQVVDAAAKALKILQGAMGKAYGDLTSPEDDNPDQVTKEEEEEKRQKRLSKKDRALLKELDEYLAVPERCSAAGNKYFSKILKEMAEDPEEKADIEDIITEEDEAKIEESIGQLKNVEARLNEALYRASGKRVWG